MRRRRCVLFTVIRSSRYASARPCIPTKPGRKCLSLSELRTPRTEQDEKPKDGKGNLEVIIRTTEEGFNGGRSYIYRSDSDNAVAWEADIDKV